MRLSEYIRIQPKHSPIDVTCTVDTRHVSKLYYQFTVDMPHTVFEPLKKEVEAVFPKPQLDVYVCPNCMIEFMGDCAKSIERARELMPS